MILSWPVVLLAIGLGSSAIHKSSVLHPMYSVGIFLPHHMIWHNAYLGLSLHPDWKTQGDRYDGRQAPQAGSDSMAWTASALEATERYGLPEAYLLDGKIGGLPSYKMVLHEKLIKERYLRFSVEHPRYMLELFLWCKPRTFVTQFAWIYGDYSPRPWTLVCLMVFLVLGVLCGRWLAIPRRARLLVATAGLIVMAMSLAPVFWTYPMFHVSGESFLILTAIGLFVALLLLSKAWSFVRPVVRGQS